MQEIEAINLLPQRPPFQFIDDLVEVTEQNIKSRFTVKETTLMLHGNALSENALLENMAQTAAAGTGYFFTSQQKPVPVGYIGAIKKILIHTKPQVGETIQTEIQTLHQVSNATIVQGKIFLNDNIIALAELTIFVNN